MCAASGGARPGLGAAASIATHGADGEGPFAGTIVTADELLARTVEEALALVRSLRSGLDEVRG